MDYLIAFYHEAARHIGEFDRHRFRRFYDQHPGLLGDAGRSDGTDSWFNANADLAAVYNGQTLEISTLHVTFFGHPDDSLLTSEGTPTPDARALLDRVSAFRQRIESDWDARAVRSRCRFSLVSVSFEIWIGLRRLGAARYGAFQAHTRHITSLERGRPADAQADLRFQYAAKTPSPTTVRSYDTFLDHARLIALRSDPFEDQGLLAEMLNATDYEHVIRRGLARLTRSQDNAQVFEAFLASEDLWTRAQAVLGSRDTTALEGLLTRAEDRERELVRSRLSVLNADSAALRETILHGDYFLAYQHAIDELDDRSVLDGLLADLSGDSYDEQVKRHHVEAKLAYLRGDDDALNSLLADAGGSTRDSILRLRRLLDGSRRSSPRVFISYKREGEPHNNWVRMLASDLRAKGVDAYLDEWDLRLGDSVSEFMAGQISSCDYMVFVITEESVAAVEGTSTGGGGVRFELQLANAKRMQDRDFRVIGVLRSGRRPPIQMSDSLYVDFRFNYEYAVGHLADAILGRLDKPKLGGI